MARLGADAQPRAEPAQRWDDCGWVANRWCELLPMPPANRQRLMELDNPLLRLELVADELDRFDLDAVGPSQPSGA